MNSSYDATPLFSTDSPISSEGILSYQLRQQEIDPSRILFSEVQLSVGIENKSSVVADGKDPSISINVETYDDNSIILSNRYGRKVVQ